MLKPIIKRPNLSVYVPGKIYKKSNGKLYRVGPGGNLIGLTPEETKLLDDISKAKEAKCASSGKAE